MCGPYGVKTGHSHEFTGRECVCSDFLGLRGCFVRVERMQLPQRGLVGTKKILRLSVWRDRFPVQGHVTIVRESFFTRLGTFPLYRSARLCLRTGQSFISKEMPVSCIRAHLLQHTKMPHQSLSHSLEDNLLE